MPRQGVEDPLVSGPSGGDGRNISAELGRLSGEGSRQKVPGDRARSEGVTPSPVWTGRPADAPTGTPTYYDRPVIKEPVWIWAVPVYFFFGGAAGAAAVLGEAARLGGGNDLRALSGRCRWTAAAGTSAGAVLLIYDLGRPGRFLNMLRVFRPTSAMSVGSWVLAVSGALSGAAAVFGRAPRPGKTAADVAALGSAALGLPLAAYTAVLLADTAVPFWQEVRKPLPALFVSSAAASAASILKLPWQDEVSERVVRRFGIVGTVSEMACSLLVEKQSIAGAERVGKPLKEGLAGRLWTLSKLLSAASLVLALSERGSRPRRTASGVLGSAGGLVLRFAIFHAGKASARDPRASFELQRAGPEKGPPDQTGL